jgi:bacterioferritin
MSSFLNRIFGSQSPAPLPIFLPLSQKGRRTNVVRRPDEHLDDFMPTTPMIQEDSRPSDVIQSTFFLVSGKLRMLDRLLATQCVFMLRYRRNHGSASVLGYPVIAENFLRNSNQAMKSCDRIASRIVQLGGLPDYSPQYMDRRSHVSYENLNNMKIIIGSNMMAERSAMRFYRQMALLVGHHDETTRKIIDDMLSDSVQHSAELTAWMSK